MSKKPRSTRDLLDSADSSSDSSVIKKVLRDSSDSSSDNSVILRELRDSSDSSSDSSVIRRVLNDSSESSLDPSVMRKVLRDSSDSSLDSFNYSNQNLVPMSYSSDSSSMDGPSPSKKSKTVANKLDIDYTSNTQIKLDKFCYKWTINNYSFGSYKTGQSLQSPKFLTRANGKYQWALILYPRGVREMYSQYVSLYLHFYTDSNVKISVHTKYKFCILNSNGERINQIMLDHRFHTTEGCGSGNFIESEVLENNNMLLPDDSLTILCEMYVSSDDNSSLNHKEMAEINPLSSILSNEIKCFLENVEFSDITLRASKTKFHAHKVILAARSKVFSSMFQHNLRVKKGNIVNLYDVKPKILKEMLRYIYTDEVEDLQTSANDILIAAIKYDLEGLKLKCEKAIANNLRVENVIEVLLLAERHNLDYLKSQCRLHIMTHNKDVIDSKEFRTLEKTNPQMTINILKSILAK